MSLWDAQQREWLQAMGHSLWVLASDEPDAVETLEQAVGQAAVSGGRFEKSGTAAHPGRDPADAEPRPSRPARSRVPAPVPVPVPVPQAPAASPAARPRTDPAAKAAALEAARIGAARQADGPLREALLRATGQPPAVAARTLRGLDVDQTALRDDPAAKRALWIHLRPLRKAAAK